MFYNGLYCLQISLWAPQRTKKEGCEDGSSHTHKQPGTQVCASTLS